MNWIVARIYERFMRATEEACLRRWRAELLTTARGRVLEIGAGAGANLPHYSSAVTELVLSEPDPYLRGLLRKRTEHPVIAARAEALPAPNGAFDCVVVTLVLCSVTDLARSLSEIRRVLRPDGRLFFLEHVAAEDRPARLRWQERFEPLWRRIAGNCHCTRRTADAIRSGGFRLEELIQESMRKALPIVRPSIRGVAVRARTADAAPTPPKPAPTSRGKRS